MDELLTKRSHHPRTLLLDITDPRSQTTATMRLFSSFLPKFSHSRFKQKSKSKKEDDKSKDDATDVSANTSKIGNAKADEVVLSKDDIVPENAPEELRVVREWIRYKDAHDVEKMEELTDDNCYITFTDSETEMPAREFYEALRENYASFPDIHFFWRSMKVQGTNSNTSRNPGTVVVIKDYYGIGTHTGAPYHFGPYPPIERTNKIVRDADIEFTFIVRDGKIVNATVYAFGEAVGPPAFYTKIGGVIM